MEKKDGPAPRRFFIKSAIIITPGCVRIQIVQGKKYYVCAGTWFEWQSPEAVDAFRKAELLNRPLKIPAKGVFGSDMIKDVEIYWKLRWKHREKLLANWVMCS